MFSTGSVIALSAVVAVCTGQIVGFYPSKDPRCHQPLITGCNSSLYPIMDYKETAWFFHQPFKSCRPLYTAGGVHVCAANKDLPLTKSDCEDICAEECILGNGSKGICMLEEFCRVMDDKTSSHPRPCHSYNVNCCARDKKQPKLPNSVATKDPNVLMTNLIAGSGPENRRRPSRVGNQNQRN